MGSGLHACLGARLASARNPPPGVAALAGLCGRDGLLVYGGWWYFLDSYRPFPAAPVAPSVYRSCLALLISFAQRAPGTHDSLFGVCPDSGLGTR